MTDYLAAFPSQFAEAGRPCPSGVGVGARSLRASRRGAGDDSLRDAGSWTLPASHDTASLALGVPGGRYPYLLCREGGDLI